MRLTGEGTGVYNPSHTGIDSLLWGGRACFFAARGYAILRDGGPIHMSQFDFDLAKRLHRFGLGSITATLLEGLAPLAPLGAQGLYMLEPLFGSGEGWHKLAGSLEDPDRLKDLASNIRHGG